MTLRDSESSERLKTIVSLSGPMTQVNLPVPSTSQVKVISSPSQAALPLKLEVITGSRSAADSKPINTINDTRRIMITSLAA